MHVKTPSIHFNFKLSEEVLHNYYFTILKQLIWSLFAMFIPLYIYSKTNSLFLVGVYLSLSYGLFAMISPFVTYNLLRFLSLEKIQLLSIFLDLVKIVYLVNINFSVPEIVLLSIIDSMGRNFYWHPYHLSFTYFGKKKYISEIVTLLDSVCNFISIVSPFIASILIFIFGFRNYYFGGIFILILGLIFLRTIKKETKVIYDIKVDLKYSLLFIGNGFWLAGLGLTIFFIYYYFKNILIFGAITSISTILITLMSLFLAKYVDKHKNFTISSISTLLQSNIISMILAFPKGIFVGLGFLLVKGLTQLTNTPFYGFYYRITKENPSLILERDFFIGLGRFLILSSLLFLPMEEALILGIVGMILYGIIYYVYTINKI
jgi:hypothetical protein